MPIVIIRDTLQESIKRMMAGKDAASADAKPLFDMLGLWGQYGQCPDPEADSDYAEKTKTLVDAWAKAKGLPLSLFLPGHSPMTPEEAQKEASSVIDRGLGLVGLLNTAGIIAEAASAGQMESVIWAMTNILHTTGIPQICADLYRTPVDVSLKTALTYRMNQLYLPLLPDIGTLVDLRARGFLTGDLYNWAMQQHGYSDWASEMMAYAKTRIPDADTVLSFLRRGFLSQDVASSWLRKTGLHPDAVEPTLRMRWQIPPYQDLISTYVREGYLEEKWVEIPGEFVANMEQLGYDAEWTKRLWGKHWILPSVDHLYEMFWKQIITYEDMASMLKYHDYEPVWRDRLIANAYRPIPRVDLRRAYRWGMLSSSSLLQRYGWLGYNPRDASIMTDIATRDALSPYYTRLEQTLRAAYRKGVLVESDLRIILGMIGVPAEAINLIVMAENLARQVSLYDPGEVQVKPEPVEVNRDLVSAASQNYRAGLLDPDSFARYLRKAGLSDADVEAKKAAEDLRYYYDYSQDLIALAREAYKKDVYTQDEFYDYLIAFGVQPERVSALVALETLRKLPKPKAPA